MEGNEYASQSKTQLTYTSVIYVSQQERMNSVFLLSLVVSKSYVRLFECILYKLVQTEMIK